MLKFPELMKKGENKSSCSIFEEIRQLSWIITDQKVLNKHTNINLLFVNDLRNKL